MAVVVEVQTQVVDKQDKRVEQEVSLVAAAVEVEVGQLVEQGAQGEEAK